MYPISDLGTIGFGLMSAINFEDVKAFKSPVATLNINQLKVINEVGLPVGDTESIFSIEEQEPSFQWAISAESSIYNRPEPIPEAEINTSPNRDHKQYPLSFNTSQINYRITVRKPTDPNQNANTPHGHIYFEFTGYNDPAADPSFTFTSEINNPDIISDLRGNNSLGEKYENVGTDEKSTFYKVLSSGFMVRDSEDYPLRKFDLVVEPQDQLGTTAANNLIYAGTIGRPEGGKLYSENFSNESNDLMGEAYDIIGINIEPPSGMFLAIDPLKDKAGNIRYLTNKNAADSDYPYRASIKLVRDALEVGITPVTTAAGNTTIDEETFERFFNNVEGVVFYYTTGDNSEDFDPETNTRSLVNLAPEFNLNIKATKENGHARAKTNENIKNNRASQIAADGTAFDGLVTIDSSYATHRGAGDGQGNNPDPYLIYRSFYELGDGDNLEKFIIPFPMGLEADNINITMGFYDTLSYNRAFIADDDIIRYSSYTEGNDTYKIPKILQDVDINFSTIPKNVGTTYTLAAASLAGGTDGAFLESLGTPIFIPQFNLNNLVASSLSPAGWAEITVCHTYIEAVLATFPTRRSTFEGTDKVIEENYFSLDQSSGGVGYAVPLEIYNGTTETLDAEPSNGQDKSNWLIPMKNATPTFSKGLITANNLKAYAQVISHSPKGIDTFSYKTFFNNSLNTKSHIGSSSAGRMRAFIVEVPLDRELTPDNYTVHVELEIPVATSDKNTGLTVNKPTSKYSYEIKKREGSFTAFIYNRLENSGAGDKTSHTRMLNTYMTKNTAQTLVAGGGARIKFVVYANLE